MLILLLARPVRRDAFSKAISRRDDRGEYFYWRALADYKRAEEKRQLGDQGNEKYYNQVLQDLDKAMRLDYNGVEVCYLRGMNYYNTGHYREAIQNFNRVIELEATPHYYYLRGMCYYSIGRFEEAVADLTRAIDGDSSVADYRYWRGLSYKALHRTKAAEDDFAWAENLPN